jgi:hypothetical protein
MNDMFFAYSAGPVLATILFIGLPVLALIMARLFVKKL